MLCVTLISRLHEIISNYNPAVCERLCHNRMLDFSSGWSLQILSYDLGVEWIHMIFLQGIFGSCQGVVQSQTDCFSQVSELSWSTAVHRWIHTHMHAHIHTCMHMLAHAHTHARTHTRTHARTHARTHTHTHTHTHTILEVLPMQEILL